MRIWNLFALGILLAVPGFGQTTPIVTAPKVPILIEATLPTYPFILRAARISGKVIVLVTVKDGRVIGTNVKLGEIYLRDTTIANLKTWRFDDEVNTIFTVTYTYAILSEESDTLMNPKIEILPSLDVNITVRPVRQTVQY
jgi:hypothetical protein